MKKITLLSGILTVQIILTLVLLLSNNKLDSHAGIQKLLEFDREQINVIQITDRDGKTTRLKLNNNNWFTEEQFPADSTRIDQLLNKLSELEHGLPVANSAKSANRFEVDNEHFQRRLQLLQSEQAVVDMYLGTGAGARHSHIRLANDTSIFSTTIGSYDLPTTIAEWQDKNLLLIETDTINSVELNDLKILKQPLESSDKSKSSKTTASTLETKWLAAEGLANDETLKTDAFKTLLKNISSLRYLRAFKGSVDDRSLLAEISLNYGENSRTYTFYGSAEDNELWLTVSDYQYIFVLSEHTGKQIIEVLSREKILDKSEIDPTNNSSETIEETLSESE